jgi:predicted permease
MAVVTLTAAFAGLILALSTQFEAAWIGSPIRRWTRYAIPVALAAFVLALTLG